MPRKRFITSATFKSKYEEPEELEQAINCYFEQCREDNILPTDNGIRVYLDICYDTWVRYRDYMPDEDEPDDEVRHKKERRAEVIKKTKDRLPVEIAYYISRNGNCKPLISAALFALKQPGNGGWTDKQAQEKGPAVMTVRLEGANNPFG